MIDAQEDFCLDAGDTKTSPSFLERTKSLEA